MPLQVLAFINNLCVCHHDAAAWFPLLSQSVAFCSLLLSIDCSDWLIHVSLTMLVEKMTLLHVELV